MIFFCKMQYHLAMCLYILVILVQLPWRPYLVLHTAWLCPRWNHASDSLSLYLTTLLHCVIFLLYFIIIKWILYYFTTQFLELNLSLVSCFKWLHSGVSAWIFDKVIAKTVLILVLYNLTKLNILISDKLSDYQIKNLLPCFYVINKGVAHMRKRDCAVAWYSWVAAGKLVRQQWGDEIELRASFTLFSSVIIKSINASFRLSSAFEPDQWPQSTIGIIQLSTPSLNHQKTSFWTWPWTHFSLCLPYELVFLIKTSTLYPCVCVLFTQLLHQRAQWIDRLCDIPGGSNIPSLYIPCVKPISYIPSQLDKHIVSTQNW